jgi:hypothetical protein
MLDILTKREYLYRQLFATNNKVLNLPFFLTNNPSNPLFSDVKAAFLLLDSAAFNNEYSRDVYYSSLEYFNYSVLKSFFTDLSENFVSLSVDNFLSFALAKKSVLTRLGNNNELYKSQYRPMRKGITNMIRLHGTGAVAMPIELRLQVLASSRDVIHSWSIPSAGVKIDCVPGYSSHRVMIFLVSGIFWGQCMEICGRYHH